MVSTRGPKSRYTFEKGEKVLCYEPDPTKAKVLYDSKILGIYETKDKRSRKVVQYKVHFQGWSNSWDRKVNADFLLKDSEENRQLQRSLAEKAQLQIGAYLYRRDRKERSAGCSKKVLNNESVEVGSVENININVSPRIRARGSSEDNFSSSSTFERHEEYTMKDDFDSESYCSSVESVPDEDRVMLRVSERLRQYLEYDRDMVINYHKQHALPSRIPVVSILEKFVQHTAVKMVMSATQTESTRRRTTQQRTDKKEREFDRLVNTVGLLKEVADGLRIYFDFTLVDYLLYKEEKEYALSYLSEEYLKNFTYIASPTLSADFINPRSSDVEHSTVCPSLEAAPAETTTISDETQKRKLRSHRNDDCDLALEQCLSSITSTSSGASTPLNSAATSTNASTSGSRTIQTTSASSIPPQAKDYLQSVLAWRLLPSNAAPASSMIFGAPHLARLIVKMPEFLNASTMSDEKLKTLLQHLDTFVNFLEEREDWFNEDNYLGSTRSDKQMESKKTTKTESTSGGD